MGIGAKVNKVLFALAVVVGCGTDDPGEPRGGGTSSDAGAPGDGGEPSKPMGGATNVGAAAGHGGTRGEPIGGEAGQAGSGDSGISGCSSGIYKDELSETQPPDLPCGALGDLEASSGVIFNLGLSREIAWLRRTDNRLLGTDADGNWALWNLSNKTLLASGQIRGVSGVSPDQAGDLFTLLTPTRLEIRSLLDGSLINAITTPDDPRHQGGLSLDGSYYWSATADGITAWDSNGRLLATKSGNYSKGAFDGPLFTPGAQVIAAPGELRIGMGPAGDRAIERISLDTGTSTTSPFSGNFHSWFLDGERFLTTASTTIRVYSADTGTEEQSFSLPYAERLVGQADYFWMVGNWEGSRKLVIFAVADPNAPVAVYPYDLFGSLVPIGNRIGLAYSDRIDLIELDPAGLKNSSVGLPTVPGRWLYTWDTAGNVAFGNERGLVFDGSDLERSLSCGTAYALAGSEKGTIAMATAYGILLFELRADSRAYLGSIPFPSYDVDLSRDGSVLAAASLHFIRVDQGDTALRIWSLPDQSELRADPAPPIFNDVRLSALGNLLSSSSLQDPTSSGAVRTVSDLDGNVSFERGASGADLQLVLSEDGSRIAVQRGSDSTVSDIYENGTVIESFTGYPLLWIDEDHLLMDAPRPTIYRIPGGAQPGPNLEALGNEDPQLISSTEVYAARSNKVFSLSTGEELWSCETTNHGAVAADNIAFIPQRSSNKLVSLPY